MPTYRIRSSSKYLSRTCCFPCLSHPLAMFLPWVQVPMKTMVIVCFRAPCHYSNTYGTSALILCFELAARQQVRSQQPARMPRLAPIERGPWASRKAATTRDFGEGLDGPDYDPGTRYGLRFAFALFSVKKFGGSVWKMRGCNSMTSHLGGTTPTVLLLKFCLVGQVCWLKNVFGAFSKVERASLITTKKRLPKISRGLSLYAHSAISIDNS